MANDLPTPATTQEYFAAKAAGVEVETPTPITPMEKYLDAIAKGGGGDAYTKAETDALLDTKADKATTYTKTEIDNMIGNINAVLEEVL